MLLELSTAQLVGILVTLFVGYCAWWWTQQPNCPGPLTLPIIGPPNFYPMMDKNTKWFNDMTQQYGCSTWTSALPGLGTFIAVVEPTTVEYILKTNFENYVKGQPFKSRFQEVLGDGIFAVDGPMWKQQRKTASHMFNVKTLSNSMLPVFVEHGHDVVEMLRASARKDETVDMQDIFARYTLDSISKIAFGTDDSKSALQSEMQDFAEALKAEHITAATFGRAFDVAQQNATWRFLRPFWRLRRALGFQTEKDLSLASEVLDTFARRLIAQRCKEGELEEKSDVLSWFMQLKDDDGQPFSDQYLRDIIMNFMVAGRDTTANALTWTFHLLSKHPECIAKIRAELDELGIGKPGDAPSWEDLRKMKYTEAVIKETLRLYPSVPRDPKMAVKDDTLPDGTVVRAGQCVAYLPYAQGRLNKLWGKEAGFPHDAEVFYPDRWMAEDFRPSMYLYPVFQAGLRTCLGKDMALLEAKVLTAMLVAAFDFEVSPEHPADPEVYNSVTCPMAGGLPGRMKPRTA